MKEYIITLEGKDGKQAKFRKLLTDAVAAFSYANIGTVDTKGVKLVAFEAIDGIKPSDFIRTLVNDGKQQVIFKVLAISKKPNSFGLYGVIIACRNGLAYQLGISQINLPAQGDQVYGVINDKDDLVSVELSYEIPQRLPNISDELITEQFPNAKY